MMEIDIVAESTDGGSILIGGAKWRDVDNVNRLIEHLRRESWNAPFVRGREVYLALWLRKHVKVPQGVKVTFVYVSSRQSLSDSLGRPIGWVPSRRHMDFGRPARR